MILRAYWGRIPRAELLALLPTRTWRSIREQARKLGLTYRAVRGLISASAAAQELRVDRAVLGAKLRALGLVRWRRCVGRSDTIYGTPAAWAQAHADLCRARFDLSAEAAARTEATARKRLQRALPRFIPPRRRGHSSKPSPSPCPSSPSPAGSSAPSGA